MLTPPQPPVTNFGMDLKAGNNLPADFASPQYNLAFIVHKATEGATFQDSAFTDRRTAIEQAGIPFGAYHFCSKVDVQSQVDNFLSVVKPPYPLLALDWEEDNGVMTNDQARQFLQLVQQQTGITPLIYGSNFVTESDAASTFDPVFAQARLWLASPFPSSEEAPLPDGAKPPFTKTLASWPSILIWQYTSDDKGYAKPAFAAHFDGADFNQIALADLKNWPFHDPVTPPPAPAPAPAAALVVKTLPKPPAKATAQKPKAKAAPAKKTAKAAAKKLAPKKVPAKKTAKAAAKKLAPKKVPAKKTAKAAAKKSAPKKVPAKKTAKAAAKKLAPKKQPAKKIAKPAAKKAAKRPGPKKKK